MPAIGVLGSGSAAAYIQRLGLIRQLLQKRVSRKATLGFELQLVQVHDEAEFEPALAKFTEARDAVLLVLADPLFPDENGSLPWQTGTPFPRFMAGAISPWPVG